MGHVLAAPDKFRGTAGAAAVAGAVAAAARAEGWTCDETPVSDGGEGILDVLGGIERTATVTGPLGTPVEARWRQDGSSAVIEMAQAAGLELAGGREGNDPMEATTVGVGELINAAIGLGAHRIVVGLGGSATTDGGLGAYDALRPHPRLKAIDLVVACDVETTFVDAAEVFAPQKGASPKQVALLRRRLERLAQVYEDELGIDVRDIPGSGAAGGLGGALAALGARLLPGFDLVADAVALDERVAAADLVVTGEGLLDEQSFAGKVVGGVLELAQEAGRPTLVVVGDVAEGTSAPEGVEVVSLVARFGEERARREPLALIEAVVREALASLSS